MTLIRVVRHLLAHQRFWDSFIPRTSLPQVPPYPRRYGSYQKFCQTSPPCGFQGRAIHSTTNRVIYFPSVGWIWFCICDLIFSSPMASDSACKGVLCSIYVFFFFFFSRISHMLFLQADLCILLCIFPNMWRSCIYRIWPINVFLCSTIPFTDLINPKWIYVVEF